MASLALSRLPQQLSHQCRPYLGPFHRWWRCHRPPRPPNLVFMHVSNYPIAQLSNRKSQMFLHTQFNLIPFLIRLSFLFSFFFLNRIFQYELIFWSISLSLTSALYDIFFPSRHGTVLVNISLLFPPTVSRTNNNNDNKSAKNSLYISQIFFLSFIYIYIFFICINDW